MWAGMPGIFLRQIHEKQYPASLEPYTGNILLIAVTYDDARVKSLKPRCACTGVVLRLSDPPDMSIKVERQLHDMRILDRIMEVRSTEQSVRHLSTPVSYHTFVRFSMKTRKNPQFRQIFDFCRYCGFFLTGLFYFPVFSNGSDHINNIFWHIRWWNNMHWIQ